MEQQHYSSMKHLLLQMILQIHKMIQKRVLGYFCKCGFINKNEVEKMLSYENNEFSLDAKVRIQSWDKDGLGV